MGNWKAALFLLATGQGMLLTFALIVKGFSNRRPALFLGLILYVMSMELLNAWGMQVHYHSVPGAFAFWIFQSYLLLPLALWFFMQLTTCENYIFKKRIGWFFHSCHNRDRCQRILAVLLAQL